jgi:hypothetical protein
LADIATQFPQTTRRSAALRFLPLLHLRGVPLDPKKMTDIEPLDKRISVRLTAAEKIKLAEDAQIAGLGLSELVRRRYFGRPIIANADAAVLRELRRLGGLLKYLNSESAGAYNQQVQETLSTLKDYMEVLCDRQESSK